MNPKLMLLRQLTSCKLRGGENHCVIDKVDDYDDGDDGDDGDDIIMMMMMMMMMMIIMTIVSVEQRPGWGEHV